MTLQDRFPEGREVVCVKTFEVDNEIVFQGEVGYVWHCTIGDVLKMTIANVKRDQGSTNSINVPEFGGAISYTEGLAIEITEGRFNNWELVP